LARRVALEDSSQIQRLTRVLRSFPTRRSSVLKSYRLLAQVVESLNLTTEYYMTGNVRSTTIWNPPIEVMPSPPNKNFSGSYLIRSEEHTSALQSRENLVSRPLLEKKKTTSSAR